ncbi:hypothetical protein FKW77_006642 [Venturia effusa]|uniref:Uncharacterized protein n=1 Tax=Venturia effusa TaxID=50376 RepID=A0A517LHE7_9PEZI|nr:hypothetical protein FKW77_006642 [Venturia effusa]
MSMIAAIRRGQPTPLQPSMKADFNQVQLDIATLTRAERQRLRQSLLATLYFDFLQLPFELRETVYELVLMSSSGKIRRFSSPGRHKKSKTKAPRQIPTSILSVSRQVYLEARDVLYRKTTCKLSIYSQFRQVGHQIERNDKLAFVNFRQVILDIHVTNTSIEYNDKAVGSIGHFLADLVDMLVLAFDRQYNAPKTTVRLDFRLWEANDLDYKSGDDAPGCIGVCLYRKVWYRAQIAFAFNKMKSLLCFRVPNLILTTNVETSINGFRAQKVDACKVRFWNERNGDLGILSLWPNGHGCKLDPHEETDSDD